MDQTAAVLKPVLAVTNETGLRVGEERFRLLEAIGRLGSISAAAREAGLSYKAAWDATNALNNLFAQPLVKARPGGRHGGGAEVTAAGRCTLHAHRRLMEGLGDLIGELQMSLAAGHGGPDIPVPPLWSFLMRTSARNCFHGIITSVTTGSVSTEVALKISATTTLTAILTNQSANMLALHEGQSACALVNASTPILARDMDGLRLSARNRIHGSVLSIERGAVNTDVVLDIGAGKTLAAVITNDSAQELALEPGTGCGALIKASQIILGVE
ncbi:TOBE domain-containing protein [Roseibium marinum]|uniref:Molybdate transport system regulatory protein n=1 Tax=Roseibium marinum TaxID=281252 RepID=A0A2S3V1N9_9HYPH|nr:TOBE domain-containing protein [Roseibium marinum]POF33884.1 molybdate transport system regulatory protein [Roseibium marinum]